MKSFTRNSSVFHHGDLVACEIDGTPITGRISFDPDDNIFICQDIKRGDRAVNKFGYKYSWRISMQGIVRLNYPGIDITNLTLLNDYEIY